MWLAPQKTLSVEELETLLADTKPRKSYHQSPGRERLMTILKGQERAIFSQTNTRTVSKAMLGNLKRDGVEHSRAFPSTSISS